MSGSYGVVEPLAPRNQRLSGHCQAEVAEGEVSSAVVVIQ
jgi:hypothetical protein